MSRTPDSSRLDHRTAARAAYIDFEGDRNAPAVLGFVVQGPETLVWGHFVVDEELHPAASLADRCVPTDLPTAALFLAALSEGPEAVRLVAWSSYEASRLREGLGGTGLAGMADLVVNPIRQAERWRNRSYPHNEFQHLPKGRRNRLGDYLDLIGYQRSEAGTGWQPAEGIHLMRQALRASAGDPEAVPTTAVRGWRRTLARNFDDCNGLRELMLTVTAPNGDNTGRMPPVAQPDGR